MNINRSGGNPLDHVPIKTMVNCYGEVCDYGIEVAIGDNGVAAAPFPSGGGITCYFGSNLVEADGVKEYGLMVNLQMFNPANNAAVYEEQCMAKVMGKDAFIIYLPCIGFLPDIFDVQKSQLEDLHGRFGSDLASMETGLSAIQSHVATVGIYPVKIAVTVKNVPVKLNGNDGRFQDAETRDLGDNMLTPEVISQDYILKDTLDDDKHVSMNCTQ